MSISHKYLCLRSGCFCYCRFLVRTWGGRISKLNYFLFCHTQECYCNKKAINKVNQESLITLKLKVYKAKCELTFCHLHYIWILVCHLSHYETIPFYHGNYPIALNHTETILFHHVYQHALYCHYL